MFAQWPRTRGTCPPGSSGRGEFFYTQTPSLKPCPLVRRRWPPPPLQSIPPVFHKGSFSGFETDGRISPQGAAAKPGGNFMAIELTLIFKAIPKESQKGKWDRFNVWKVRLNRSSSSTGGLHSCCLSYPSIAELSPSKISLDLLWFFLLSHVNSSEEDLFFGNQTFSFCSKIALTSATIVLWMQMQHNRAFTCCEVRGADPVLEQQKYKE